MNLKHMKICMVTTIFAIAAPVSVFASDANTKLIVQDGGGVDKTIVQNNGFVGIGLDPAEAPYSSLHMKGTVNSSAQVLTHTNFTNNGGGGSFVGLHNNANGALPVNGDRLGYFYFGTKSGANYRLGGGMAVYAEGNWTDSSWPTAFKFETASATTGGTFSTRIERMRINSNGSVGIGTNAPKQALEVNGGIRINNKTIGGIKPISAKPACSNTSGPISDGGVFWFTEGSGTKDTLEVCAKDSGGNYGWRTIY